jgi:hypothetical protein
MNIAVQLRGFSRIRNFPPWSLPQFALNRDALGWRSRKRMLLYKQLGATAIVGASGHT